MADAGDLESLERLAGNDDPVQHVQDTFEQARIREALQQIPTQERTVIELAFWGGMTQREIALHCSLSARHRQDSLASRHAEIEASLAGNRMTRPESFLLCIFILQRKEGSHHVSK